MVSRYLKVGAETVYGEGCVGDLNGVRIDNITMNPDRGALLDESIEEYYPAQAAGGAFKMAGNIALAVRPTEFDYFMEACLGGASPTDPGSLEMEVGEAGTAWQLLGVGINSIEITYEAKELVKASIDYIAREVKTASFVAPTFTDNYPFVFWQASVLGDAVAITGITKLTLKVERSLKEDMFTLDDFLLDCLVVDGVGEMGGTLTTKESQFDEIKRAMFASKTGTAIPVDDTLKELALVVGVTNDDGSLTITAPIAIYTEASWEVSGRDVSLREVPYKILGTFTVS